MGFVFSWKFSKVEYTMYGHANVNSSVSESPHSTVKDLPYINSMYNVYGWKGSKWYELFLNTFFFSLCLPFYCSLIVNLIILTGIFLGSSFVYVIIIHMIALISIDVATPLT